MSVLDGREKVKVVLLREDYKMRPVDLPTDDMAPEFLTKTRNNKRFMSWCYVHKLLKAVYGFPGIPDGTKVLFIYDRDIRFDPLHQLDDSWSDEKIRDRMVEVAKEQQHKVEESQNMGILTKTQVLLSASVVILALGALVAVLAKAYGG